MQSDNEAKYVPAHLTAADQNPAAVAKRCYQAYIDNDRAALEPLIAADFHFSSPRDNRIDRQTYFERCWPSSNHITDFKLLHLVPDGERVFITYQGSFAGRPGFQNTEILTVRDGQLIEAEVYFGWSLPHKAPAGGFID